MKAVQVPKAGGEFELVERPIPGPGAGQVRVAVEACGVCHSDAFVKEGTFPGIEYPRVPGHEVAGRIDAVGAGVTAWKPGQRVGVGWHGGHCFNCESCRRGDFIACQRSQVCGISYDGGYAQYLVAPDSALALIPDALDAVAAAPLLCAGVTTFNALRHAGARPGDLVAVQGIGGLGHLAIQFAKNMGFRVAALSSGADKRELARELGADFYIDTGAENPVVALTKLGGAKAILATAPSAKAMEAVIDGLGVDGRLVVVGVGTDKLSVGPLQLIGKRRSVSGWPSGSARDSQDTLEFSALTGVAARVETFALAEVKAAYARMIENKARFRVVLTMR
ncbi:MAG: alcohol dehydrogenase catalytic domain-containing protein [Gammaproteobacteria bacterium]|nr:alcohol dehydrogenase catalytic domain-containing protein [Gammaproteobacteria bacterium]